MRTMLSQVATTIIVGLLVAACTSVTSPVSTATSSPTGSRLAASPLTSAMPRVAPSATATSEGSASPTWTAAGAMVTPRQSHTATLLRDGRVLVAGGSSSDLVTQAEVYDPGSGSWTGSGGMIEARYGHSATLLSDGKVLVAGGIGGDGGDGPLASTELYDPGSGSWTATGKMAEGRTLHTATMLPDGRVLVAGGNSSVTSGGSLASVELYDPTSGSWTAAATLDAARYGHTATLLPDGGIIVVGGTPSDADHAAPVSSALASAELYDPVSGSWTPTGSMGAGRGKYTAELLSDGSVLAVGGNQHASTELYNRSTGTWTATGNLAGVRFAGTTTLLSDGRVLLAGGYADSGDLASAELFDPGSGSWAATASMAVPRFDHTATLLPDGNVLVAGGGSGSLLTTAEIYVINGGS